MSVARSLLALALAFAAGAAFAQGEGPSWRELSAQQRAALAPLEREWSGIDEPRKRKWLDLADRVPRMSPDERARVQDRMAEWSRLSPDERTQARQRYQQSRNLSTEERQQRWQAYQALPPERRRELADQREQPAQRGRAARADSERQKSNLVPNPAHSTPPKAVGPTVQQARPGASTTSISRTPPPPPHQQTGLPKIAVQPGFVDRNTLLPQRGAQGAATTRPEPPPSRSPR